MYNYNVIDLEILIETCDDCAVSSPSILKQLTTGGDGQSTSWALFFGGGFVFENIF